MTPSEWRYTIFKAKMYLENTCHLLSWYVLLFHRTVSFWFSALPFMLLRRSLKKQDSLSFHLPCITEKKKWVKSHHFEKDPQWLILKMVSRWIFLTLLHKMYYRFQPAPPVDNNRFWQNRTTSTPAVRFHQTPMSTMHQCPGFARLILFGEDLLLFIGHKNTVNKVKMLKNVLAKIKAENLWNYKWSCWLRVGGG